MPHHDFRCLTCKHKQEKLLGMTNLPDYIKCEKCGNNSERLIGGGAGVIFKGEGWTKKFHNQGGKKDD